MKGPLVVRIGFPILMFAILMAAFGIFNAHYLFPAYHWPHYNYTKTVNPVNATSSNSNTTITNQVTITRPITICYRYYRHCVV